MGFPLKVTLGDNPTISNAARLVIAEFLTSESFLSAFKEVVDYEVSLCVVRVGIAVSDRKFEDAAAEQAQIDAWMTLIARLEQHAKLAKPPDK